MGFNVVKMLTVLSFFRLKSDDLSGFQWTYPTLLTGAIFAAYFISISIGVGVDAKTLITSINTLMAALVGFFIAALAAVVSMNNDKLNNVMSGDAPKFPSRDGGFIYTTRRRFLAILIGYCAFLAIILFVLGSLSLALDLSLLGYGFTRFILEFSSLFIYVWLLSSLLVVTMLCLHYLIDRAHR